MPEDKNDKKNMKSQGWGDVFQALALATTIGMELAISVVLGFYGGRYIDHKFSTGPWFMLAGILTGLAVGIAGVFKTLQGFFERE
ncbi:MAG TPA: AtpZ/AtpI family protein [Bacillota bacterium]|nr:AtpZ/AtpI family protein [Bacillota bacterium]